MLARKYIFAAALVFSVSALGGEAGPAELSAAVNGVRVARPNILKEGLIWPSGTTVMLLVSSPVGELIRFDAVDSAVTKFADAQGNDLKQRPVIELKPAAQDTILAEPTPATGFGQSPKIGRDGKTCLLEVFAPGLPAKGSAHLQLSGTATMLCATERKETVVPGVVLKNGTKIAGPGNMELTLAQVGKPEFGHGELSVILRSQRELDELAEVKFFDAFGMELKAARTNTSTMAIEGAVKVEWSYTLAKHAEGATVKLYTWSDARKKSVKFDLKVELGL